MSIFSYHLFLATTKNRPKLPPQLLIEKDLHTTDNSSHKSNSQKCDNATNVFADLSIHIDVIAFVNDLSCSLTSSCTVLYCIVLSFQHCTVLSFLHCNVLYSHFCTVLSELYFYLCIVLLCLCCPFFVLY